MSHNQSVLFNGSILALDANGGGSNPPALTKWSAPHFINILCFAWPYQIIRLDRVSFVFTSMFPIRIWCSMAASVFRIHVAKVRILLSWPATNARKGLHFLLRIKNVGVRFPFLPLYGRVGYRKLDSFNFRCCISGIRIAAIASAFQAELWNTVSSSLTYRSILSIHWIKSW